MSRRGCTKWPFDTIAVGEAFDAPKDREKSLRANVSRLQRREGPDGRRFEVRATPEGVRVRRTR